MRVCSPWQGIPTFLSNRLIVSFLIIYLLAICFLSQYSSRDPTSLFFRPYLAYQPSYSSLRDRQARSFIEQAADEPFKRRPDAPTPQVCLAIRTVARHGVEYFSATVGSLLDTLNATERDEIFFIPLLAHSNPRFHPAFWEKWLDNLADVVLTYDLPADGVDIKKMRGWERDNDFNSKTLWDLTYLLKRCVDTGAEYVLVVEDDVVAARGWYEKMKDAVREVESKMWEKGLSDFFYLRLFYTEKYQGWNTEYWPTYLLTSLSLFLLLSAFLLTLRRFQPHITHTHLSVRNILTILFICLPLTIILFFAAGRVSMLPQPSGVQEMNSHVCCSQSMIFPTEKVRKVIEYFELRGTGNVDTLVEEYADIHGERRWAQRPCLMQHVGGRSSKARGGGLVEFEGKEWRKRPKTSKIWNFEFEETST